MSLSTLERAPGGFDEEHHEAVVLPPHEAGAAEFEMMMARQELIGYAQEHGNATVGPVPEDTPRPTIGYNHANPEDALRTRTEVATFATYGDVRGPEYLATHPEAAAAAAARLAVREAEKAAEQRRRMFAGFALWAM
jgi:hypothetical protein